MTSSLGARPHRGYSALERASALREALDRGELAPHEAALVTRTLEHESAAGEWREVQERLDRVAPATAPGIRIVHVDATERLPAPRAVDAEVVEPVEPR